MEEAERFDWLAAMNAGRVLAIGSPAELKAGAGVATLEEAFIALLPEEQSRGHHALEIPPRRSFEVAPVIAARDLTCRFGDFTAVDRVSFTIERGEIFGFLGSNGCGKTTTMKMLTGLLAPSEGEALLFGEPLKAGDMSSRYRVGYMSQSFSLYTELTVGQNLDLHAHLFHLPLRKAKGRIAELVGRFGLEDYLDQRTLDLPLGIRQRLSLAVAIVHEPEILILDEPTSGVDPLARDRFWEALVDLSRNQGVTIFVSTHFMNEAERCDRISLMDSGRVLATDTPATLIKARGVATLEDAFISYLEEASQSRAYAPDIVAPSSEADNFGRSPGCGYSIRVPYDTSVRTVYVPMFRSLTFRREIQMQLTELVIKEIEKRTPYKVVGKLDDGDTILEGTVNFAEKNIVVESPFNLPRQLTSQIMANVPNTMHNPPMEYGDDGLIVTFSDGTTGAYVVEELLELRPIRERVKTKTTLKPSEG